MNRLISTDSYKHSHAPQYPEGTEIVSSYIESRGGIYDELVMAGIQRVIKQYLVKPITMEEVLEAKEIVEAHGEPFNFEGWKYIATELEGKIPLRIRALPEGTVVKNKTVMVVVENTDPKCFFLTSFFETLILRGVWYPTQVATTSWRIKKIIKQYLEETGNPELLPFKLHDFGARGVSSGESAAIGGVAHLMNFMGTDTMEALVDARRYYNEKMAGFSIPASEHSTMTILGKEGEVKQMRRMVENFAGEGKIYACVSDGYDIFDAVKNKWGKELRTLVISSGGTLVVRPDSGDPVAVTLRVIELLGETFGYTENWKGFKVLHPSVRMIQGDGVNESSINAILMNFKAHGWSADNIAFGMGGALLQHHTRDDNKWAMKCSAARINGVWVDVFKDPVTDKGKVSKKGRQDDPRLVTYFENGELLVDETLTTIRERLNSFT